MTYTALTLSTSVPVSGDLYYLGFQPFIIKKEDCTEFWYAVQEETIKSTSTKGE